MKTTEQNNRMIADWLGLTYAHDGYIIKNKHILVSDLKYHTSWDCLMAVVEKIENLGFSFNIGTSTLTLFSTSNNKKFLLQYLPWVGYLEDEFMNGKIIQEVVKKENFNKKNATYQAVCQFIEWYNENK